MTLVRHSTPPAYFHESDDCKITPEAYVRGWVYQIASSAEEPYDYESPNDNPYPGGTIENEAWAKGFDDSAWFCDEPEPDITKAVDPFDLKNRMNSRTTPKED